MRGAVPERRSVRRYPVILGRSPALWYALVVAALNAGVVVFGVNLTAEQLAALNAFALAVLGVIANESDPTTVPTFAPTLRDRRGLTADLIRARLDQLTRQSGGRRASDQAPPDPPAPGA